MIEWKVEGDIHTLYTTQMAPKGAMRHCGSVVVKDGKYNAEVDWEPLNYHEKAEFQDLHFAKYWVEHYPHCRLCAECNKMHEGIAFCEKCQTCLYNHSEYLNDEDYPLFKCTKCGQINFWD